MKFAKFFLFFSVLTMIFFSACKKNVDNYGTGHGVLQDTLTGDCLPKTVNGYYKRDSALGLYNFIDVHVLVDTLGHFEIKTDTVNGYSFTGTGIFSVRGDNVVRLFGSGVPVSGGTNTFTVSYGGNSCWVNVTVAGAPIPAAAFSFADSATNNFCFGAMLSGTYTAATPVNNSDSVVLKVNVTTPGTYNISTSTVNGLTFSGSGRFLIPGIQTIKLGATGIPLSAGAYNFSAAHGASSCTFTVTVASPSGSLADFTLGGTSSTCTGFNQYGVYSVGVPLTAADSIVLQVNVNTIGSYAIVTNPTGGIQFSASGSFTTTGVQNVVLTGSGTPNTGGLVNFTASCANGSCIFTLAIQAAIGAYTLGGTPGTCSGATAAGTYAAGTSLTGANTVSLVVNVTAIGLYSINTTSNDGILFSNSGTFNHLGAQTVTLTGSGTPTSAGTFNYSASAGGTNCTFSVAVNPAGGSTSSFTLAGAPGACTAAFVSGTYLTAAPVNAANTVTLAVNVTTPGTYTLATNTVNGYYFSGSGVFPSTGLQAVTLTASGTPVAAGTDTFTPQVAGSGCTFNVTVN